MQQATCIQPTSLSLKLILWILKEPQQDVTPLPYLQHWQRASSMSFPHKFHCRPTALLTAYAAKHRCICPVYCFTCPTLFSKKTRHIYLLIVDTKSWNLSLGKRGFSSPRKYSFKTPATELMSRSFWSSARGSSPAQGRVSTCSITVRLDQHHKLFSPHLVKTFPQFRKPSCVEWQSCVFSAKEELNEALRNTASHSGLLQPYLQKATVCILLLTSQNFPEEEDVINWFYCIIFSPVHFLHLRQQLGELSRSEL